MQPKGLANGACEFSRATPPELENLQAPSKAWLPGPACFHERAQIDAVTPEKYALLQEASLPWARNNTVVCRAMDLLFSSGHSDLACLGLPASRSEQRHFRMQSNHEIDRGNDRRSPRVGIYADAPAPPISAWCKARSLSAFAPGPPPTLLHLR